MRVVSFDPGSRRVGYAAVETVGQKFSVLEFGTLDIASDDSEGDAIMRVHQLATRLISTHDPGAVAIESLYFNANAKTAIAVAQTRGVLILAAAEQGKDVRSYTPPEVKKAVCGYGKADKDQVQSMVRVLCSLSEKPQDDAADALAIAICHLNTAPLINAATTIRIGGVPSTSNTLKGRI